MNDVGVHDEPEIAADRARRGLLGIRSAHELAAHRDRVGTGEHHLHDRTRGDVLDETLVERLALVLAVVRRGLLAR